MPLKITKAAELVGSEIVITHRIAGDIVAILTNLGDANGNDPGPQWEFQLVVGEGNSTRNVTIILDRFLSKADYEKSAQTPLIVLAGKAQRSLVFFRGRFFLPERDPRNESERQEIILRAKKAVYQEEAEFTSLRSFVSNMEAAIEYRNSGPTRDPIPEDVKLLVWARDGGACIRCGSKETLHFDHIIPVAKGGGNLAANVQILCEACNLRKSDKIAF